MSFFDKLKQGLKKTKNAMFKPIQNLFRLRKFDDDMLDELEEILITSDIGVAASEQIMDELRDRIKSDRLKESEEVLAALKEIISDMIGEGEPLILNTTPSVILVIGVNGVGKTTSIAKIAN
ncbi:MAG: signal recognition particle receptor subunit alpha, partial [Clostridia bacterium]|nr:signal recognition particle receptor subunit alpha [Clostridia bacterium]